MTDGDLEREERKSRDGEAIKVTDRRHFTASGERRSDVGEEVEEAPRPSTEQREPGTREHAASGFDRRSLDEPETVDFTMLVNAMAQPALLFLGELPHPATGEATLDLEQAKIQIDMLGLLGVKCRGNLTAPEERLLDRVLYQLRMLYVARAPKSD